MGKSGTNFAWGLDMMYWFDPKKMFFCLFLFCFGFFPPGMAYPERWMRATSQKALKKEIKQTELAEQAKALCLLQLKKQKVPYGCYTYLHFLPEDSHHGSPSRKKAFLDYLNEQCHTLAPQVQDLSRINKILQIKEISAFCRQKIEQQKKIREYQLRDADPSHILNWLKK